MYWIHEHCVEEYSKVVLSDSLPLVDSKATGETGTTTLIIIINTYRTLLHFPVILVIVKKGKSPVR